MHTLSWRWRWLVLVAAERRHRMRKCRPRALREGPDVTQALSARLDDANAHVRRAAAVDDQRHWSVSRRVKDLNRVATVGQGELVSTCRRATGGDWARPPTVPRRW